MAPPSIKVLLVDDSPLALAVLKRIIATSPQMEIVGTASNGREALSLIPQLQPTVVCTDVQMPVMDGLELTRRIMSECPLPILAISSLILDDDSPCAFEMLRAGALDVMAKPRAAENQEAGAELARKIRILAGVKVISKRQPAGLTTGAEIKGLQESPVLPTSRKIVAVAASTGGPQALQEIFAQLPANFPLPILCVQHITQGFLGGLLSWLGNRSQLRMKTAEDYEVPLGGTVYFAPEQMHLQVDAQRRLRTVRGPEVDGHLPSATVMMRSLADRFGADVVGVLLTGMGCDGAEGMQSIFAAGGMTLAQCEDSCIVFGMPKRAIEIGAVTDVLPLQGITNKLLQIQSQSRDCKPLDVRG